MKRSFLSACCSWVIALSCYAYAQQQAAYQLRVDTRLIETTVTVHDARGALVNNLPQDAFHIHEDGVEQKIRYFASKRELPLSIALIIDASGSQEKFVREHEAELEGFLGRYWNLAIVPSRCASGTIFAWRATGRALRKRLWKACIASTRENVVSSRSVLKKIVNSAPH
jgi:VWFA-related protein